MDIVSIIRDLGFPIACVVAMAWYLNKTSKDQRDDSNKREERQYLQMEKFSSSLDNFNDTLIKIDSRLEALEKKIL